MKKLILSLFVCFAMPVLSDTLANNKKLPQVNSASVNKDPVLIEYKGKKIKLSEIVPTIVAFSGASDFSKLSKEQMIKAFEIGKQMYVVQLILAEEAKTKQFEKNPKYKAMYQKAYDDVSMAVAIQEKAEKYSDADLQKAYANFAAKNKLKEFQFNLILCSDSKTAESVINSLSAGASFEALAKQKSLHQSKERGGLVNYTRQDLLIREFGKSFVDNLSSMVINKNPSKAIMLPNGYFAIVKLNNSRSVSISFQEAKKSLSYELASKEYYNMIEKQTKNGKIKFFDMTGALQDPNKIISKN